MVGLNRGVMRLLLATASEPQPTGFHPPLCACLMTSVIE